MSSLILGLRYGLSLLLALSWMACSPGAVEISQSPSDPSNPKAPEAAAVPSPSAAPMPSAEGVTGSHPSSHSDHRGHTTDAGPRK